MRTNRLYSCLGYVNLIFQYSDMSETETEYLRKYFLSSFQNHELQRFYMSQI